MAELVPPDIIEETVGARRQPTMHVGRAVEETRTVFILHSQRCRDSGIDLRECRFSVALDLGIDDVAHWWDGYRDVPVALSVWDDDRLRPLFRLSERHGLLGGA